MYIIHISTLAIVIVMLMSLCCVCSEEDDEEPLDWLPIAPEIEEPEDTGWGQLEVSTYSGRQIHVITVIHTAQTE